MSAATQAEMQAVLALQRAEHAQYLTFMLGTEVFAIGILAIKEIIEYDKLTKVPMMPRSVRGVINLRGAVVPVVDLSTRFGREPAEASKRTCIVIVETAFEGRKQVTGVLVDAVNEVLDIPDGDIEPVPNMGSHALSDFIAGMGKVGGQFVIILNAAHVLATDEINELAQAGAAMAAVAAASDS